MIINQAMARQFWPQGDPLTRSDRDRQGRGAGVRRRRRGRSSAIVGDVRDGALNEEPQPTMYVPFAQVTDGVTALNSRI